MNNGRAEVQKFLDDNCVPQVITLMIESICNERPSDVVTHMISWLKMYKTKRDGLLASDYSTTSRAAFDEEEAEDQSHVTVIDDQSAEQNRRRYSCTDRRRAVSSEVTQGSNSANIERNQNKVAPNSKESRQRIERCLMGNILFRSLEKSALNVVCSVMFECSFDAGDTIIKQYDEADNFYVVDSGICNVYVQTDESSEPEKVSSLGPGSCFGELALMYGVPRAATVKAATDVRLWALDRDTYRTILLRQTIEKRNLYSDFLRKVPILESLTDYERLTVADALQPCRFNDGEVVVTEGTPGLSFYMIMEGKVKVTQTINGQVHELTTLGQSDFFGEIALMLNQPRLATVTAIGDVACVKLDRDSFIRLLGPIEDILRRNMKTYSNYIAQKL